MALKGTINLHLHDRGRHGNRPWHWAYICTARCESFQCMQVLMSISYESPPSHGLHVVGNPPELCKASSQSATAKMSSEQHDRNHQHQTACSVRRAIMRDHCRGSVKHHVCYGVQTCSNAGPLLVIILVFYHFGFCSKQLDCSGHCHPRF